MADLHEVRTVVEREDDSSSVLAIGLIAILALVVIGLFLWQPWATVAPTTVRETTIIEQPSQDKGDTTIINPPDNNTTIVNPPPADPPKTEININEPPPQTGSTTGG